VRRPRRRDIVAEMRVLGKGFAAALVFGGLLPATAGANVTLGNPLTRATDSGVGAGVAPAKVFVTSLSGDPATRMSSPVNGTVVSWNVRGSAGVGGPHVLTLRVLQPSGTGFIGAGSSSSQTIPTVASDVMRSFGTSIPIRIGDQIGIGATPGTVVPSTSLGSPATFKTYNTFADGSPSGPPVGGGGGIEPQFNAVVAPTNTVVLSAITRHKKKGTASLTATLPNPGTLAVKGKLVKPQTLDASAAGNLALTLRPNRQGKKKLKLSGKASGKIAFTFTPSFGDPATRTTPVRLKLTPRP
jgi:hypothetical protein